MNAGLKRVRLIERQTESILSDWRYANGDILLNRTQELARLPNGKRYVVASLISMIGGGDGCKGELDIATCLSSMGAEDNVVRWVVRHAEECQFSREDHLAAHGSEERFGEWYEMPL